MSTASEARQRGDDGTGEHRPGGFAQPAARRGPHRAVVGAMTIDVEDYFQVEAFATTIDRSDWDRLPMRVERNTHRLLDLLAEAEVQATFFVLGCVARRCPSIARRVVADGHELASHGNDHLRVDRCSAAAFRDDVRDSKRLLEDTGGVAVNGYRAPTFSIGRKNSMGARDPGRGRLPLQLERLPGPARFVRQPRCAARRVFALPGPH